MLDTSILLVEDNRDCEVLALRALKRAGFTRISVAHDGAEALALLLGETPQHAELVLLDLRLPKLDGVDVLQRLRASKGIRQPKVIALSSSEDPSEIESCLALGVVAVMTKPLDADALKNLLYEMHDGGALAVGGGTTVRSC